MSTPSLTKFLLDRKPLTAGPHPYTLSLRNADRTTLQWITHDDNVGLSATIALYGALTDRETQDLATLTPANPYWSPLLDEDGAAIVFAALPAAIIASGMCRIPRTSFSSLLAIVTVAGGDYTSFSLLARTTG